MIYSFCIKTNNQKILDALLNKFECIDLDNIFLSRNKFKIYDNIIIHYSGNNHIYFYEMLSSILTSIVLEFYEKNLFKNIINSNYFYFTLSEKSDILKHCEKSALESFDINLRKHKIYDQWLDYVLNNKTVILDGFVTFRLKEYKEILDNIVDYSINNFLVQREYLEFIELLKLYISSKAPNIELLHLVYLENNAILLDSNKNVIPIENNIANTKFLSDISFSRNDYCLNTILTLLPSEICIHLIDEEDEFINTLKLVFEKKVTICHSCDICKTMQKTSIHNLLGHK